MLTESFTKPPPGTVTVPFASNFVEQVTWTPATIVPTTVNFPNVRVRRPTRVTPTRPGNSSTAAPANRNSES